MSGTFNDFWKTWKTTLPQVAVNSETSVAGLSIAEGTLSRKGMIHAVTDAENRRSGFKLLNTFTQNLGSHTQTIAKYKYRQRRVLTDIGSAVPASFCTAGMVPTWLDGNITIGAPIEAKFTIADTDILSVAKYGGFEGFKSLITDEIKLAIEAVHGTMERRAITEFNTLRGLNLTNGAATAVDAEAFKTLADFNVNRAAGHVIRNEFRKQQHDGGIIAVGDERFNDFADESIQLPQYKQGSGLSSEQNDFLNNDGQAIARNLRGIRAYDSQHVDAILDPGAVAGTNSVCAWKPGAFQMIEAYDFAHPSLQIDEPTYKKGTMVIDYGGVSLMFDYVATYQKCESGALGWTWTFYKKIGFFAFPKTDQYQATDPLYQSNGLALFNLTAGA